MTVYDTRKHRFDDLEITPHTLADIPDGRDGQVIVCSDSESPMHVRLNSQVVPVSPSIHAAITTSSPITMVIDASNGSVSSRKIHNQKEYEALGVPFKSVGEACKSLPEFISHPITLNIRSETNVFSIQAPYPNGFSAAIIFQGVSNASTIAGPGSINLAANGTPIIFKDLKIGTEKNPTDPHVLSGNFTITNCAMVGKATIISPSSQANISINNTGIWGAIEATQNIAYRLINCILTANPNLKNLIDCSNQSVALQTCSLNAEPNFSGTLLNVLNGSIDCSDISIAGNGTCTGLAVSASNLDLSDMKIDNCITAIEASHGSYLKLINVIGTDNTIGYSISTGSSINIDSSTNLAGLNIDAEPADLTILVPGDSIVGCAGSRIVRGHP
jgi:hypothetical protein